ncbi:hypothetical protein B0H17DRAFT_1064023 [Mycena rosella]|uniref:Uncharacterized protein n=1 Tax=Mycena rosella TaxID=1033263 RepID=A0AAD7GIM1_MYCRO|nr:hypothetical protein B0H17DRAFT_1064023 [Mycena rosella]
MCSGVMGWTADSSLKNESLAEGGRPCVDATLLERSLTRAPLDGATGGVSLKNESLADGGRPCVDAILPARSRPYSVLDGAERVKPDPVLNLSAFSIFSCTEVDWKRPDCVKMSGSSGTELVEEIGDAVEIKETLSSRLPESLSVKEEVGESEEPQYSERALRVVADGPAVLKRDNEDIFVGGWWWGEEREKRGDWEFLRRFYVSADVSRRQIV